MQSFLCTGSSTQMQICSNINYLIQIWIKTASWAHTTISIIIHQHISCFQKLNVYSYTTHNKMKKNILIHVYIRKTLKATLRLSRPKTHSKGVTVISHFKPEGLQCNLTQILILLSEVTNYQVPVQSSGTNLKSSIFNLKTKTSTIQNPLSKYLQT